MYKLLTIGILLFLISCGHKTNNEKGALSIDTLTSKTANTSKSAISIEETSKKNDKDNIPEVLNSFIPKNYSAITIASGDANLDGLMDKILVLKKNTEELTSKSANDKPEKRPLLLLLGQPDNSYKLAFRNDNAVYCFDCGGVFGDPFTGITIKNGYFSIEHGISGGQHWEHVITFKYDRSKNNWLLYKDHYISYKLNESNDPNAEALVLDADKLETSKNFGTIYFDEFNIYNEDGN